MVRRALRWAAFAVLVVAVLVLALRWVNPPVTWLMASEWWRLGAIEREWRALPAMSPYLPLSAVAAEDADFCVHSGFDIAGIRAALADDTRLRGGSTISQQVAKNVFLWPARSWLRKGLEAGFTVLIEILWPKRRILEVYLNVAEFDAGVFGVEAASRRYFGIGAADVGPQRAARLMAVLPDPKHRSPVSGTAFIRRRGAAIESGAATIREDGRADCFL
ncbi:MAG: monofunctional biosynthetic peptidoglycan transglycosylase [Rhodobacteraceae bacterium]|nr:monofunctional biosynthetic peptidoglycan transglycosylase [Paracoccaceae bacterium]MCC0067313.1 monofunctional biosynthetic peptidoglycan transglycosylase [Rhodovulum sp.]